MGNNGTEELSVYDRALQIRQQKAKEAEAKKQYSGPKKEYEVINWQGLEDNSDTVIRIYGRPLETRKEGFDAKLIFWSKVLNDNGSFSQIVWKQKKDLDGNDNGELDQNWILNEFYNKVRERKWENYKAPIEGKKGKFHYVNEDSEAFKRIESNKRETDKYPPKFYPAKKIIMNVISRMDDWSIKNNHTSLLSNRHNFWKNDDQGNPIYFTDPGIPTQIYDLIFDNVVAFRKDTHDGWNLDIIIKKSSKKNAAGKTEVDYIVKDILEDKLPPSIKKMGNANPLTADELKYERYNLDKLFQVSSYQKILKNLGNLFKIWDSETKDDFYDRLLELAKAEKEEWEKNKTTESVDSIDSAVPFDADYEAPKTAAAVTISTEPPKRGGVRAAPAENLSIEQLCEKHFPHWKDLNATEQKFTIQGIDKFDGSVPIYKVNVNTFPCECSDKFYTGTDKQPETVPECTRCFMCGVKFSVS